MLRTDAEYERHRRGDGKRVRKRRREYYWAAVSAAPAGMNGRLLGIAMVCMVIKAQQNLSYRGLVEYIDCNLDAFRIYDIKDAPSKSKLHAMSKLIASAGNEFLYDVLGNTAAFTYGDHIVGDATGFGTDMYVSWHNAKYGNGTKRDFVKLHVLAHPGGPILAFEVTVGTAGDSPIFRKMFGRVPKGSGTVALDAAYDARVNCDLIVRSGRVPVIRPKKRFKTNGFDARAKMCRWLVERPDEFKRAYGIRSKVEAIFSSMKRRTGALVRARSLPARTVELFARVLCYNMTV